MGKHSDDKKLAKLAANFWKAGKQAEARALIARMSPAARQEIINRVIKGMQISQGRN